MTPEDREKRAHRQRSVRGLLARARDPWESDADRAACLSAAQQVVELDSPGVVVTAGPDLHYCSRVLPSLDVVPRGTLAQCPLCERWSFAGESASDYGGDVWVKVRWYHRRQRAEVARIVAARRIDQQVASDAAFRASLQPPRFDPPSQSIAAQVARAEAERKPTPHVSRPWGRESREEP